MIVFCSQHKWPLKIFLLKCQQFSAATSAAPAIFESNVKWLLRFWCFSSNFFLLVTTATTQHDELLLVALPSTWNICRNFLINYNCKWHDNYSTVWHFSFWNLGLVVLLHILWLLLFTFCISFRQIRSKNAHFGIAFQKLHSVYDSVACRLHFLLGNE